MSELMAAGLLKEGLYTYKVPLRISDIGGEEELQSDKNFVMKSHILSQHRAKSRRTVTHHLAP